MEEGKVDFDDDEEEQEEGHDSGQGFSDDGEFCSLIIK